MSMATDVERTKGSRAARILLVEDDRENCLMLREVLGKWGYEVREVFTGHDAVRLADVEDFDIVLADIRMPGVDGLGVLKVFRSKHPEVQVIMMTGFGSIDTAVDAMKAGAFDYLSKPFKFDEIKLTLTRALEKKESLATSQKKAPASDQAIVNLLGHSRAMAEIYKTIAKAAAGTSTVLVLGESGTGKELVARAIHHHSDRASKQFVAVNCAAMAETLLESELFGYAKGAHSTATADKPGLFETASGGTLFLDEVGDTSLGMQAKLLRALQESETRRLGDTRSIKIDVRIVASTNKDLQGMIRDEKFRSDLYYRINVVTITLPPLRERREDIPGLAEFFIKKYNALTHKNVLDVSPEALHIFQQYTWPGNVRELENVIERGVILNTKSRIMLEDLPKSLLSPAPNVSQSLEEVERRHITEVLKLTRGNVKAAAEMLGIDRKTLYRKAGEYGIEIVRE